MKSGLSKLGVALTLVIAVSLLVGLVGQLLYILWRRKKLRNQSRIEPQETRHDVEAHRNNERELQELEDMIKWQALYGSSRLLFTIEEGEREGLDSETAYSSCTETEAVKMAKTAKMYMEECHGVPDVTVVTVVDIEIDEGFTTPLETPCASPPYYTPSTSPTRT